MSDSLLMRTMRINQPNCTSVFPRGNRMSRHFDALMLGSSGNDLLNFNIYGIDDALVDALLDGGAGLDTAHTTANVRKINTER